MVSVCFGSIGRSGASPLPVCHVFAESEISRVGGQSRLDPGCVSPVGVPCPVGKSEIAVTPCPLPCRPAQDGRMSVKVITGVSRG